MSGAPAPAAVFARQSPNALCREESLKATAVLNNKTIIQNTLAQMAGLYAVSQACLLSIFVPQKCPAICSCDQIDQCPAVSTCLTSPWFSYPVNVAGGHLCSLKGARTALGSSHSRH
jgi:hypothetical protein